ncbi:MAG: L-serine ammonia-lyase [Desulfohalobiaceae bacterium]
MVLQGIAYSVFDLLKVGPGPSSSHTIGPMRAGYNFVQRAKCLPGNLLNQATNLKVSLLGSLGATGKGHNTDKAVLAGLLGQQPESCPPGYLSGLLQDPDQSWSIELGQTSIPFSARDFCFDANARDLSYSNTLIIQLRKGQEPILQREYHSVGGGFVHWEGKPQEQRGSQAYSYSNGKELKQILSTKGLALHELVLENEAAITGAAKEQVWEQAEHILQVMDLSVQRGLAAQGRLPGPLGLQRKAGSLYQRALDMDDSAQALNAYLCAYGFAASEENASGQPIVTAPTCGSAGVLPAVQRLMHSHLGFSRPAIRKGLLAAAVVGLLVKHNASIAGAEVGCQGEVGVASAMAAAMLTYADSQDIQRTENAAESALEHHLGLTCDPVDGYVQIPCIERNAMGAVKAHAAYLIASTESSHFHKVELDEVILAMKATGRDLSPKYRETATGGLAAVVKCE